MTLTSSDLNRDLQKSFRGWGQTQLYTNVKGVGIPVGMVHRKKKIREFPVPSRDVTSLVSDIPARDGKLVNFFLHCMFMFYFQQNWSKLVSITHLCLMQHFVKSCVDSKTRLVPLTSLTPNFIHIDHSDHSLYCTVHICKPKTQTPILICRRKYTMPENEVTEHNSTNQSNEKITCLRIRRMR